MERARWDITDYCPICGTEYRGMGFQTHRCSETKLKAIDAAMKSEYDHRESKKPYSQRLSDGFNMLNDEDQGDD